MVISSHYGRAMSPGYLNTNVRGRRSKEEPLRRCLDPLLCPFLPGHLFFPTPPPVTRKSTLIAVSATTARILRIDGLALSVFHAVALVPVEFTLYITPPSNSGYFASLFSDFLDTIPRVREIIK